MLLVCLKENVKKKKDRRPSLKDCQLGHSFFSEKKIQNSSHYFFRLLFDLFIALVRQLSQVQVKDRVPTGSDVAGGQPVHHQHCPNRSFSLPISLNELFAIISNTKLKVIHTVKNVHGRLFLVPCKKWLVRWSNVRLYSSERLTSHFLQGARNTRLCLSGRVWNSVCC